MNRPYIISHMMESVDGRIDCAMTEQIDPSNAYYDALDQLGCPSQVNGRVTMQMHFATGAPFEAKDKTPIGAPAHHKASAADAYSVALDTHGTLRWPANVYEGRALLVVTCESTPREYLDTLTAQGISWIAVGHDHIDLAKAMDVLYSEFGVRRLALTGGGHINGSFLAAGLIDEVSVMIGPGIDGRRGMASVFDGIDDPDRPATLLNLQSVKQVNEGTVWLRYTFRK